MDTDAGKDFFISYTSADKKWAEWIAWQLEEAQYSTIIQAWDFQPGMNFVLEMDKAARGARCTIVVLSPGYLSAQYTQPEWASAFRRDPRSEQRAVLPVRVQKCEVEGLLGPIVYIDLIDLDEVTAREALLAGVRRERGKPETAPGFPGREQHTIPEPQRFPGALPPLWNVPLQRNPFFAGQDDLLARLATILQSEQKTALTQPQAITGLGGIGKTQLALEYAYRHRQDYHAVLWGRADTREALISTFVSIAYLLDLPLKDEEDQMIIIKAVKAWLADHSKWLFILDNADELVTVKEFIPPTFQGHLLLTTRAQVMGGLAKKLEVKVMKPETGALLLLRRAGLIAPDASLEQASPTDVTIAKELSEEMGGLPLALDQAGAYIEEVSCRLQDYQRLYQTHRAELLKERGGIVPDHPESVATTWSLAFQKVEQGNPAASDLLRLCAFLHPDAIPEEMIAKGANHLGPPLQATASDPLALDKAIMALRAYSLLHRDSAMHTLTIHRLVQAVLRAKMMDKTQREWAERAVRIVRLSFPFDEDAPWPQSQRSLLHALMCVAHIQQWDMAFPGADDLLYDVGIYLLRRGQYREAKQPFEHALAIRERVGGPEDPDTATILDGLATLYSEQGDYEQAKPLYERALAIRASTLGPEHPDTAQSLHNLAILSHDQGDYEQAKLLYERALALYERMLVPGHPDMVRILNSLATLYSDKADYEQAKALYERALVIAERVLGPEHPNTAQSLHNLATLYHNQDDYERAKPLYEHALALYERILGPEHPNTAQNRHNLASLSHNQGDYEQAKPIYEHALAIREHVLGLEHPTP